MNQTLTNAIMMACILLFINSTTWKGMILQKLDRIVIRRKRTKTRVPFTNWTSKWDIHRGAYESFTTYREVVEEITDGLPGWITMPLWECIICMSPWWSTGIGLPLFYGGYNFTPDSVAFILTTGGIAVILDTYVIGKREGIDG